jgi:hypothetical protein
MIPAGADAPVTDLTRWNRAGLSRFRYVDGGAAEWLEELRVRHLLLYARGAGLGTTLSDDPAVWLEAFRTGEFPNGLDRAAARAAILAAWDRFDFDAAPAADATYNQILRAQYDHIAIDQTRQISRAFARAFHILSESLNAYANEGYLATATQPEHLRRLLDMIRFEPPPAASALVSIGLILKQDAGQQTFDAGLGIEHQPQGGAKLTFESLEPVVCRLDANLLRPEGWDEASDPLPPGLTTLILAGGEATARGAVGTVGLLSDGPATDAAGL